MMSEGKHRERGEKVEISVKWGPTYLAFQLRQVRNRRFETAGICNVNVILDYGLNTTRVAAAGRR